MLACGVHYCLVKLIKEDNMKLGINKRDEQIFNMKFNDRMTGKQIANHFGISISRTYQLISKVEYLNGCKNEWWYGLSVRACNILLSLGIKSKEEATKAMNDGLLKVSTPKNCGIRTIKEITEWTSRIGGQSD
jgi:hypothetical protein